MTTERRVWVWAFAVILIAVGVRRIVTGCGQGTLPTPTYPDLPNPPAATATIQAPQPQDERTWHISAYWPESGREEVWDGEDARAALSAQVTASAYFSWREDGLERRLYALPGLTVLMEEREP